MLSQYLLWLKRSARRGRFPLQLPTFIRAGARRLRRVVRALRTPLRLRRGAGLPLMTLLHFFIAALNARRADLGVEIFVRLIAATIHFLIPLPLALPLRVLHTHLFPPTIFVTARVDLRFLPPLFLRTIVNSLLSDYRRVLRLREVLRHFLLPFMCPYLHLRVPFLRRLVPTRRLPTVAFFMRQCFLAFLKAMLSCFGVLILCRLMTDRTHFLLYPLRVPTRRDARL